MVGFEQNYIIPIYSVHIVMKHNMVKSVSFIETTVCLVYYVFLLLLYG